MTLLALLVLLQEEEPKLPREWAAPDLVKVHTKFVGTYKIEFADKGRIIALLDGGRKATIYEFKDWQGGKFVMSQAMPCTGTNQFWRDFTGEVQNVSTRKHTWVSNKERPVAVTPDGNMIFIARNERSVQMYTVDKPEAPKAEFDAHSRGLMDLFVHGNLLVTIASQEVRSWKIDKLTEKPKEAGFGNAIRSFALSEPDNRYLALNMGKYVHALDVVKMTGKDLPEDMEAGGGMIEFAPDGKSFVVVTPAKTATVYRSGDTWKELLKISGDETKVVCAALSPNGAYLAWIDPAGTLHFSHVEKAAETGKLELPGFKVASMTWHPNGNTLYLCAEDGKTIREVGKKK